MEELDFKTKEEHKQNSWIEKCRKSLIDSEKQNLRTRALYWTQIVNMKTCEFNNKLNIRLNVAFESFEYLISSPLQHLGFLISWKGLRNEKLMVIPTKYHEFEFKAKNWICGRRAPNYAQTLFPEMIINAEQYAMKLSIFMFKDNQQIANLYKIGLMFGYLSSLCSSKITLNDRSKKTYLLFENSIKKERNPTIQLLQKYTNIKFPNNLQNLYQYFQAKYEDFIHLLQKPILTLYQQRQHNQKKKSISSVPIQHSNIININNQQQLGGVINNLLYLQQQQQATMHYLTDRVFQLEHILTNQFNIDLRHNHQQLIQQQNTLTLDMMMNDSSTTSATSASTNNDNDNDIDITLTDTLSFGTNTISTALNNNNNNNVSINTLNTLNTMNTMNTIPIQFVSATNPQQPVASNNNNNNNNNSIPTNTVTIVNNMYDLAALIGNV